MSELAKKIEKLPPHARKIIEKIVASATLGDHEKTIGSHWLMTNELYALFGLKLAMYHAVTSSPLNKTAFENILVETCNDLEFQSSIATKKTADVDVILKGFKTSLKSEGRIHDNIHISKFCELGWGPWEKPEDLYFKIHRKDSADKNRTFESRIDIYDKILSLRNEIDSDGCIKYELVEIPSKVFRRILEIPLADYKKEMAASKSKTLPKSFKIRIPWSASKKDSKEIVVNFDGGGERKLTITLPKDSGIVVATWSFNLQI